MQRRDFFGIIAAPLLRRLKPAVPTAGDLSVQDVKDGLAELAKMKDVQPISVSSPCYLQVFRDNRWERVAHIADITGPILEKQTPDDFVIYADRLPEDEHL